MSALTFVESTEAAVEKIDGALKIFSGRSLLASDEVCDLLLDLRLMLLLESSEKSRT